MPREPKPKWHKGNRCWYARVGEPDETGRARAVYFTRPLESGIQPPAGEKDEGGAWAYLNALRKQKEARWIDTADCTVAGLAQMYLAACKTRVAEKTMVLGHFQTLQTRLGKFARFPTAEGMAGSRLARTISPDDLAAWIKFLKQQHKPNYVKNCVRAVQGLFSWGSEDIASRTPRRLLARNPIEGVKAPRVGRMPERFAERKDAAAFLKFFRSRAVDRFDRLTILLERVLIRTGCRPGEACGMRWDQIRWNGGTSSAGHKFARVVMREHKTDAHQEKPRVIYLTPVLTRALRRVHDREPRHAVYVFTHRRGSRSKAETPEEWGDPWDSGALGAKIRKVRAAAIEAKVAIEGQGANRIVNYLWRHTAISTLLMMGVDIATVADLTGTSPEMIRSHYGHILDAHLAAAAEKLTRGRRPGR